MPAKPKRIGLLLYDGITALVADWIKRREPVTRRIASVYTGIYALA